MSDRPGQGEDRDLLFGVLALHMDLIGRDELIAAINTWSPDRSRPLGVILRDRGAIDEELRDLIDRLVARHLSAHGDDLRRSLATIPAAEDLRETVSRIAGLPQTETFAVRGDGDRDAAAAPPSAPSRFGALRPHEKGGLGEVFLARDFELNRDVALKRLQSRHARSPESRSRFLLEAEITGGLEHPGVVPVYSLGLDGDGQPYYAMRFIRGHSLGGAIDRFHKADLPGRDPGERALALRKLLGHFLAACHAIDYAHSRGVLHRDLKPANIMVGDYGETLVVDWGLAKVIGRPDLTLDPPGPDDRSAGPDSGDLTLPGSVLGTPAYMSPEQAAGEVERMGPATDIYGLGATLYAILTGRAPVESTRLAEVLDRVRRGDFPRPREVKPSVTPELEAIALRAMALRPEDRFPGARAIGDAIESWLADVRYRQEQSRALDEVKAQLARLAFEQALHHFQGEGVREGLLWLVRALSSLPEAESDLRRLILLNLDAWGSQVHRLVRWFPTKGQVHSVAFSHDGSRMAFAESGDTVRIRDADEGRPIGLPWCTAAKSRRSRSAPTVISWRPWAATIPPGSGTPAPANRSGNRSDTPTRSRRSPSAPTAGRSPPRVPIDMPGSGTSPPATCSASPGAQRRGPSGRLPPRRPNPGDHLPRRLDPDLGRRHRATDRRADPASQQGERGRLRARRAIVRRRLFRQGGPVSRFRHGRADRQADPASLLGRGARFQPRRTTAGGRRPRYHPDLGPGHEPPAGGAGPPRSIRLRGRLPSGRREAAHRQPRPIGPALGDLRRDARPDDRRRGGRRPSGRVPSRRPADRHRARGRPDPGLVGRVGRALDPADAGRRRHHGPGP
ncbi:MAG: protein kinase [Isosphaeraceae bacterium]